MHRLPMFGIATAAGAIERQANTVRMVDEKSAAFVEGWVDAGMEMVSRVQRAHDGAIRTNDERARRNREAGLNRRSAGERECAPIKSTRNPQRATRRQPDLRLMIVVVMAVIMVIVAAVVMIVVVCCDDREQRAPRRPRFWVDGARSLPRRAPSAFSIVSSTGSRSQS